MTIPEAWTLISNYAANGFNETVIKRGEYDKKHNEFEHARTLLHELIKKDNEESSLTKLKNRPNLNGWDFNGIVYPEHSGGEFIYVWSIERPEGRAMIHHIIEIHGTPASLWYGNDIAANMQ